MFFIVFGLAVAIIAFIWMLTDGFYFFEALGYSIVFFIVGTIFGLLIGMVTSDILDDTCPITETVIDSYEIYEIDDNHYFYLDEDNIIYKVYNEEYDSYDLETTNKDNVRFCYIEENETPHIEVVECDRENEKLDIWFPCNISNKYYMYIP